MIKAKYNRCEFDSCVYFKQSDHPTYLLLYVDDMLIVARNKTHVQKLKAQLKKEFDMKDLGEAKKILCVTPRSRGYENVNATYIRRAKIPSHIYVKHQYRQESEYKSTVVIYILTEKYKYTVIIGCNPI